MERLLHHIDVISRQRNRGQLEASLTGALRELLEADRIELYKLFVSADDLMVGLAADSTSKGTRRLDDGVSWPAGTGSITRFPNLYRALARDEIVTDHDPVSGLLSVTHIVPGVGPRFFGFAVIHVQRPLREHDTEIIQGLLTLFRNCVALLDYGEIDTPTGLFNRKALDQYLISILSSVAGDAGSRPAPMPLTGRHPVPREIADHWLGVIDIDHYKTITDRFGHPLGDEVLILVANVVKSVFRTQDRLFRFGGGEFVVLLKPAERENATATFERCCRETASFVFPRVGKVTISAGFKRIGLHDTPSMILDNAGAALRYAREHGHNQVRCHEELIAASGTRCPMATG